MNRQIVLKSRPVGVPQPEHFDMVSREVPQLAAGEFLVENLYLSVDPAQRGYVNDENNYLAPVAIGAVMRALAVGRIVASECAGFQLGDHLYGWFGWQDYCVCVPSAVLRHVDPRQASLAAAAGTLGINGLTAHMALHDIGEPQSGETVLVTAGAGAVGSIVGQLAKLRGCRTVAVVGSDEKGARCIQDFGYDAFVNYRSPLRDALSEACPRGVDVFFDNVAGEVADAIMGHLNRFGRIIQCGTVSIASWLPPPQGPRIQRHILTQRLRVQGFVIFDHLARFDAVAAELAAMLACGSLRTREDIELRLERAPAALVDVYTGRNSGKKLIHLRD